MMTVMGQYGGISIFSVKLTQFLLNNVSKLLYAVLTLLVIVRKCCCKLLNS